MTLLRRAYGRFDAPFVWLHPLGRWLIVKTEMGQVVAKVKVLRYHQIPRLEAEA